MFRNLTLFSLILAFCVMAMGAYVRISGAGLGCPDWPGCYGKMIVEQPETAEALRQAPFDAAKAWKEMIHRYLAGGLGVSVLVLAGLVFRVRENRGRAIALTYATLALVVGQALLGMWTVKFRVMPVIVTAHLLAGVLTLALLYWLFFTVRPQTPPVGDAPWLRRFSALALLLLFAQIFLGGWTSSNYAALSCPDFPTCMGAYWPDADYAEGFRLWRGIGPDYQRGVLPPDARVAIHWAHRIGAVAVFLVLSVLAFAITSNRKVPRLSKPGVLLSFLLLAEISLGIATVLLRLPLAAAVAHHAVAALLWLNLVHVYLYLREPRRTEAEAPAREEAVERAGAALPAEVPPPVVPQIPAVEVPVRPTPEGMFVRLKSQLGKTRSGLTGFLGSLALGKKAIDQDVLEDIESQLLMADVGVAATQDIIRHLTESLERHQLEEAGSLSASLRDYLYDVLRPVSFPLDIPAETRPFVILVVGVNGVGKTTTIGKLAKRLQNQGHSVMLAAGDTFRAAAVEQLQTWGERNNVQVVAQHTGADSASVIYDAVQAAQARGVDVLIADTAGRLHTKSNLMEELSKIKRIMGRLDETAPHEVLLVLDAGTGQNAISQAKLFNEAVGLTGIALTKLDGTAKGGVIFALAKQFGLPIRFIGIGEGIDDLQDFDARKFVDALFAE
ncbi:cytochrome oxidase assembly family protein/cell division protein FtsY [Methylocaldum marinum]|uniref:Signal recognition particle receptor FtsY n=1 Tax=Methylocaldum marinum TaxID=1432792 RepID=A0A250KZU8_9GAMM|nr:signal recognition particle-docking protein FtsY [Methylocaldum marinum]BBA36501.1 cytochrome oxidase assembly family protein/cell division protein FtsY [Methylocaldum marinum]